MANPGQEQERRLRRWMEGQPLAEEEAPRLVTAHTRVMAVTSGKGGVGKSNLTLNLGLALVSQGQRVIILDADLGMANINILLGEQPPKTLADVLDHPQPLGGLLWEGPKGIRIIPGGSGIARLAAANPVEIEGIIEGFRALDGESDWLLIDTGAGIAPNVMSFVLAADEVLVVTTPEPTALADAYGLIKAIWESHEVPLLRLVVNRAEGLDRSERMGRRLIELATRMLAIDVAWAGLIQEDPRVPMAIARQTPFVLAYPGTIASRDIQGLAARLLQSRSAPLQGASTMGRFIERLRSTFSQLAEAERGSD